MWNKVHLLFGCSLLAVFLLTGLYMNSQFPELYQGDQVVRYMYRASHIYLLFAALLHLAWSQSIPPKTTRELKFLLPNVGLIIGSLLLVLAYWLEPANRLEERSYTQFALIALIAATIFRVLLQLAQQKKTI